MPDPTADGRAAWWAAGVVAALLLAAALASVGVIPAAGFFAVFGVAAARDATMKPRLESVLAAAIHQRALAVRVSILADKTVEPMWSRGQGSLWMRNGRTVIRTDDGRVVFDAANQGYTSRVGNGWGKGGIYLQATDGQVVRFSLVTGADLGVYLAQPLIDKPLLPLLDDARRATGSSAW